MNFIIQAILFVVSVIAQKIQQDKAKAAQKAAEDAMKGFEVAIEGEAISLPIVYGKQKIAGVRTYHKVDDNFFEADAASGGQTFKQRLSSTIIKEAPKEEVQPLYSKNVALFLDSNSGKSGGKREFMYVQQAICQAGIHSIIDVEVDDRQASAYYFKHGQRIHVYPAGGVADPMATANGIPSTNLFTDVAYASMCFRLNRDKYQYNGVPSVSFYVKGQKVYSVSKSGSVYSLSGSKSYSNNPAYCLLDYLLSSKYGAGLSVSDINLESFYRAARYNNVIVDEDKKYTGRVNGGNSEQDVKNHVCNITLSTENTIRDNIALLVKTMGKTDLIWSEGKYKLVTVGVEASGSITYPVDAYITSADIIRQQVNINWPTAGERLNQMTASFNSEFQDFGKDSVTWPATGYSAHNAYLTEDSGVNLSSNEHLNGISDPYHALAYIEQRVRDNRKGAQYSFTLGHGSAELEPNDILSLTCGDADLEDVLMLVGSCQMMPDFTFKITAKEFDAGSMAWEIKDSAAYIEYPDYDLDIEDITDLTYYPGSLTDSKESIGALSWGVDSSVSTGGFVIDYTSASKDGAYARLGETSNMSFTIYPLEEVDVEDVTFRVRTKTMLGRLSDGVFITITLTADPAATTAVTAVEELYNTNTAQGVRSRAKISWNRGVGGVFADRFKVEAQYTGPETADADFTLLTVTSAEQFTANDLRVGVHSIRITALSKQDFESTPATLSKTFLGLTEIPADPASMSGQVTVNGISLSWPKATDLDVIAGGSIQLRFTPDIEATPVWGLCQTMIESLSGDSTSTTVPTVQGKYLIKFIDSTGNESDTFASFTNRFSDSNYNYVDELTENAAFAGAKSNCTVIGANLEMDVGQTLMTYTFDNSLDLGSVESVRLVPTFTAVITDAATTVADYEPISAVSRFAGPYEAADLWFEIRHTDDDPAGSPTWSSWEPFLVGLYYHRAFEFRVKAEVDSAAHTVYFSDLGLLADKLDLVQGGNLASDYVDEAYTVWTTVTFPKPFYPGVSGTSKPSVNINIIDAEYAGDVTLTQNRTKDGFEFAIFDWDGYQIPGEVDWQAVGQ